MPCKDPAKARDYWRGRLQKNKLLLVEYKGGKCCICGYNKCAAALDFHHIKKKSFAIGTRGGLSLNKLKKEADKTILVCKNCHAEIHIGMHSKYKK
jgi:hypothetical protein